MPRLREVSGGSLGCTAARCTDYGMCAEPVEGDLREMLRPEHSSAGLTGTVPSRKADRGVRQKVCARVDFLNGHDGGRPRAGTYIGGEHHAQPEFCRCQDDSWGEEQHELNVAASQSSGGSGERLARVEQQLRGAQEFLN